MSLLTADPTRTRPGRAGAPSRHLRRRARPGPLGAAGPGRTAGRHRRPLPVGARRVRLGEQLLLRGGAGRIGVVEGVLLRLLRRRELHHRRQDAALAVADGAVGQDLRAVVLEPAGPAGPGGRGGGGAALRHGPAYDGVDGGRAARRRGAGDHAGGGADVPVRQPGRAAHAAAGRFGVRHPAGGRVRDSTRSAGSRWPARWWDWRSSPRCCRRSWSSPLSAWSTCSSRTPRSLKRLGHLLVGLGAMLASAGWWVAIVSLWPAGSRPYIGGSQDNSILELTLGYNGFGRLTGNEVGSVGGGGGERRHVGRDRPGPAPERRDRRPDRLAAADRAAAARRRAVVHPAGRAHRLSSGRAW